MKNTTLALLALWLMACGSSTPPPSDSTDGDTGTATCGGYGPNDACMNEENFAACQAREAECPGQVLALESCPSSSRVLSWLAGLWTSPAPHCGKATMGPNGAPHPSPNPTVLRTFSIPSRGDGALSTNGIATRCLVSGLAGAAVMDQPSAEGLKMRGKERFCASGR